MAQLTKMGLKTEKEQDSATLFEEHLEEIQAYEQPNWVLLRTVATQDQNDPSQFHVLVVGESQAPAFAHRLGTHLLRR